jgi:hypothetical protein
MIQNHQDLITNERVIHIISHYEFFVHLKVLYFVLFPLKKAVLILEGRNTTLGDCFVSLAKIAAAIKKLSPRRYVQFRSYCIETLNTRFDEFDDDLYLLCHFLMPNFRGKYYLLIIIIC